MREYYRILRNDTPVYILDSDALTGDDYLYKRLGRTFQLDITQHAVAWARAQEYLAGTMGGIGVASDSVLTTKADEDNSGVIYRVTCRRAEQLMEYEIFCSQHYALNDTVQAAGNLAFYMVTGRRYEH